MRTPPIGESAVRFPRARIDVEVGAVDPMVTIQYLSEPRRLIGITATVPIAFDPCRAMTSAPLTSLAIPCGSKRPSLPSPNWML